MRALHTAVGLVFLLLFLLTGAYMLINFPELYGKREEVRMMYRATHIYLLMSALLNLMASAQYGVLISQSKLTKLRVIASLAILLAPVLLLIAFFVEPSSYRKDRPFSFIAIVILFAGTFIHSSITWWELRKGE